MLQLFRTLLIPISIMILCLKPLQGAFFKKEMVQWVVQKSSSLKINGASNVNKFQCGIEGYYAADTISFIVNNSNTIVPLGGSLTIDIAELDCRNKIITKDLRKTLKAEDYPRFTVRFVAMERMPSFVASNKDIIKGWVEIDLAGTCKRFDIPFTICKSGINIDLNGTKDFSFADFKLHPPKKVAGLVKVNDKFTVSFKLVLKQLV